MVLMNFMFKSFSTKITLFCTVSTRPTDAQLSLFKSISQTFGLGQTNFGSFGGIFEQFISTHFGTVSSLSMFDK